MNPMVARTLEASIRKHPGITLIDLRGEINSFAEEALNRAYAEAEQDDPRAVVLNFKEVDYINSTGIALIVGLLAKARQGRRRLLVFGLSDHYQEIFSITRLSDFITVFPDEASALSGEGVAVGG
jgi:anti-sigma B factor antagonist